MNEFSGRVRVRIAHLRSTIHVHLRRRSFGGSFSTRQRGFACYCLSSPATRCGTLSPVAATVPTDQPPVAESSAALPHVVLVHKSSTPAPLRIAYLRPPLFVSACSRPPLSPVCWCCASTLLLFCITEEGGVLCYDLLIVLLW
ncbi:hypothetical protein PVAP13_8KG172401 [Panicum virgatum]|uniref:Uncharacterized protein n=1 Tax=Panicum virgatum TaxID=38727 RepID=A0A8T0PHQ3_PANVG|nr:hypothetical protein PVAP13_8KG172401 [Panicum virgatum]